MDANIAANPRPPLAGMCAERQSKGRGGVAPVAPQLLKLAGQALRAPRCQAKGSLAGDPSEVTALGKRHWITSFRC